LWLLLFSSSLLDLPYVTPCEVSPPRALPLAVGSYPQAGSGARVTAGLRLTPYAEAAGVRHGSARAHAVRGAEGPCWDGARRFGTGFCLRTPRAMLA
jgi:hypothetical protein